MSKLCFTYHALRIYKHKKWKLDPKEQQLTVQTTPYISLLAILCGQKWATHAKSCKHSLSLNWSRGSDTETQNVNSLDSLASRLSDLSLLAKHQGTTTADDTLCGLEATPPIRSDHHNSDGLQVLGQLLMEYLVNRYPTQMHLRASECGINYIISLWSECGMSS